MSRELVLNIKRKPSLRAIRKVVVPLGWMRAHDKQNSQIAFYWHQQHISTRGCWLFVEDVLSSEQLGSNTAEVSFRAKTYWGCSHDDIEAQNHVIRALKSAFGGAIFNPESKDRSYLINHLPRLSRAEIACGLAYVNYMQNLDKLKHVVQNPMFFNALELEKIDPNILLDDQGVIINNTLLAFLVSLLESFLSDFFIGYIDHVDCAKKRLLDKKTEEKAKVDYSILRELLDGKKTLGEIEAQQISFQNLKQANSAFNRFLGIDLFRIIETKKRYAGRVYSLKSVLEEMIAKRHAIVHSARIYTELKKDPMIKYIFILQFFGEMIVSSLWKEQKFRLDLNKHI